MEINVESFRATLQFARMAMWMLFIASVYRGVDMAVAAIIACAFFSYLAQMVYSYQPPEFKNEASEKQAKKIGLIGTGLHLAALFFGLVAFIWLLTTPLV